MRRLAVLSALLLIALCPTAYGEESYWPTQQWRTSPPEEQGFDSNVLADAFKAIHDRKIPVHSLMIERNGRIILDAYFFPFHEGETHDLASATKSFTSTLIGIAIGEHKLASVRQPILSVFPEMHVDNSDPRKDRSAIEDFLTMRSGLDCRFDHGEITLMQMRASPHWVPFMLNLPMANEPGSKFIYCSGGMHVLSGVVSKVTGQSAFTYAEAKLFTPLGIHDASWPSDPDGVSDGWGDLHLQPRDMAKIGYLWLHRGLWKNEQIIPADYMRQATAAHVHAPEYGYGFWVYHDHRPAIFAKTGPVFEANGRGGQRIWVAPEKDLVIVMTGGGYEPGDVGALILPAMKSDSSLPLNAAGDARLSLAVRTAANPPARIANSTLPAIAQAVSGKVYKLGHNQLGFRTIALDFKTSVPTISLSFANGETKIRPLGLDGVPRLSRLHATGAPLSLSGISLDGYGSPEVAVSGQWENKNTFVLDYDTVSNINDYQMRLAFQDGKLDMKVIERSGLINEEIHGQQN